MASIDFSFLTDECRPDNGLLRQRLEDLCNQVGTIPIDPNLGIGCGEWVATGGDSTIQNVTYNPVTTELSVEAVPGWTSILINQINSITFGAPINIEPVGTYPGVTVNVSYSNPSQCRSMIITGSIVATNVALWGQDKTHVAEVQDITFGAPGPVIGDLIRRIQGNGGDAFLEEAVHHIPLIIVLAPGQTINRTYQTVMQTQVTGGGVNSQWFQTILHVYGQGNLV